MGKRFAGSFAARGARPARSAIRTAAIAALLFGGSPPLSAQPPQPTRAPLMRVADLDVGESATIELCNGSKASVKLLSLRETRDSMRDAVRRAVVEVEVNGRRASLVSATYRLPRTVGDVRIDCSITKGYTTNSRANAWGLLKDARLRLWPAGSPLIDPATFCYPVKQKWFATATQMANEPTYVDGGEQPESKSIYYHYGLDIGGAEGLAPVVAATAGLVVSARGEVLPGYEETPVKPRYDVVYVLDDRGWYYRYSHLHSIDPAIQPGSPVKMGQAIGVLGKEGASGGWSHLHFDVSARQPSGLWGVHDGYAFLWEAYLREYKPKVIAVARPHHFVRTGQRVELDGSRSWSADSGPLTYQWTLSNGEVSAEPVATRTYSEPGEYGEILKVTDSSGESAYDFAIVQVMDRSDLTRLPATIHAAYWPTFGIRAGDPVTFKVRSFRTGGGETWDFGDGSDAVRVKSDGNAQKLAKDGYAVTTHRYEKAGEYLVTVRHIDRYGYTAIAHLHVVVGN